MTSITTRLVAATATAALLFAGCGDDGDGGQARTVEPAETTTTESAEPSDGGDDGDGSAVEQPQGVGANPGDVILTLDDMPAGWTVSEEEDDDEDDDGCAGESTTEDLSEEDQAEASFQQSDFGPFVSAGIGRYDDDAAAQALMDEFATAVESCDGYTESSDGIDTVYEVSPLSFPQVGDDTFAARVSTVTPFGPLAIDIVAARAGSHIIIVSNGGFAGATDSALTEQLLGVMIDRL